LEFEFSLTCRAVVRRRRDLFSGAWLLEFCLSRQKSPARYFAGCFRTAASRVATADISPTRRCLGGPCRSFPSQRDGGIPGRSRLHLALRPNSRRTATQISTASALVFHRPLRGPFSGEILGRKISTVLHLSNITQLTAWPFISVTVPTTASLADWLTQWSVACVSTGTFALRPRKSKTCFSGSWHSPKPSESLPGFQWRQV
jgi:hypothetical protein